MLVEKLDPEQLLWLTKAPSGIKSECLSAPTMLKCMFNNTRRLNNTANGFPLYLGTQMHPPLHGTPSLYSIQKYSVNTFWAICWFYYLQPKDLLRSIIINHKRDIINLNSWRGCFDSFCFVLSNVLSFIVPWKWRLSVFTDFLVLAYKASTALICGTMVIAGREGWNSLFSEGTSVIASDRQQDPIDGYRCGGLWKCWWLTLQTFNQEPTGSIPVNHCPCFFSSLCRRMDELE